MNNTTIINIFKSKTQLCQNMTTITARILKSKPLIEKPIVTNSTTVQQYILADDNCLHKKIKNQQKCL